MQQSVDGAEQGTHDVLEIQKDYLDSTLIVQLERPSKKRKVGQTQKNTLDGWIKGGATSSS